MAYILAISTSLPKYSIEQISIGKKMIEALSLEGPLAEKSKTIYEHSGIARRYSVLDDFTKEVKEWSFWENGSFLKSKERNEIYKKEAPELAYQTCLSALNDSEISAQEITHVISVSCTGLIAPGIEFLLVDRLNLKQDVQRTGVNFMGCFGAFTALGLADSIVRSQKSSKVLIVCTELCTLHFQQDSSKDTMLANALFADGCAAAIVAGEEKQKKALFKIEKRRSFAFPNSLKQMTWTLGNTGCQMTLSDRVPVLIRRNIREFSKTILEDRTFEECFWALHPGGLSIVKGIQEACHLQDEQIRSSLEVLRDCGNMSSATFLFVLKNSLNQKHSYHWTLGLGFGPGLSIEGILLKNV